MSGHSIMISPFFRPRAPRRAKVAGITRAVTRRLALMWRVRHTRRLLVGMEPRLLKDIGVSRGEAQAELDRPFWDTAPRR
jgi:uncharacterized protein YjiS (DUF1127 family)